MPSALAQTDDTPFMTRVVRSYPDPETANRWRRFLASTRQASHLVSPEYFLDPRVRGKRPFALLAEKRKDIVACLTGWHEGSEVLSGMPTHPQLLIQDIPHRSWVERALILALLDEATRSSFVTVYSWRESRAFEDFRFRSHQCNSTYVLDLAFDHDALFQKLDTKRRNGVRTALKRGLQVREAGCDDVPKFHEVLKATHERLQLGPPLPVRDVLTPETNRKLFVAYYGGRCVAGTILRYQIEGLAEYSENASLPEFWEFRPNDLLLWEGIKWAKNVGCTALNFGGHELFKKEFGGTLYPVFRSSLDKSLFGLRDRRERLEMFARRVYRTTKAGILRRIGA